VNPLSSRLLARLALLGALVAALGLAGCGRKSGLDLPPAAAAAPPTEPGAAPADPSGAPAYGPDGEPLAPPPGAARRRAPVLDWLLN
jgi:predicted small lipoprotein YifL